MERKAKVSLDFIVLSPTAKGMFGDNVIAEMTEHAAVFTTPDIPLAVLTSTNNDLKLKTQQALSGDKVKIQERDTAEALWETNFRKEAEYVQRIAAGDKLTIAQSGYHATDTEVHPVSVPAQAQIQAWANKGKASGIHIEMQPLADCRGFMFFVSTQPVTNFAAIKGDEVKLSESSPMITAKLTTKRKVDVAELSSGQSYFITALGFNATGVGEFSNAVEVVAP